ATSVGSGNINAGDFSLVIGSGNEITSNGNAAFAAGYDNTASGQAAVVSGYMTTASGNYSTAFGYRNTAPAYSSFVIGHYNESTSANSSTSWHGSDPVFVVGNGTGGVPLGNIGTVNDAFVIYQNGDVKVEGDIYPNVNDDYDLGTADYRWRDIYTNGTVNTSDGRLKMNIQNITYGLATVLQLRPVNFLWKDNPDKGVRLGLIAQEVQPVIKEVVNVGDDENQTLGIRYSDLIPVLIKSIQEQQEIIDEQSQKNKELEQQLEKITQRLIELEEKVK
ncbi:MAG: tail fiber domain-containing protein, partial [Bacteroidota bacterium]